MERVPEVTLSLVEEQPAGQTSGSPLAADLGGPSGLQERRPSAPPARRSSVPQERRPSVQQERRGSQNLLQSAGIGIEKRRRSSASGYRIENNQVLFETADGKTERMEILGIEERHGCFRKAIPYMPLPIAGVLCVINVIFPSVGTLLSGLAGLCFGPSEYPSRLQTCLWSWVTAALQLLTVPFIIGWVWSIMWGVAFVQDSMNRKIEDERKETEEIV